MAFVQSPALTKNPKALTYNMIPKSYRLCASKWAWVQAGRRKAGGVAPFPPQPSTRRATYPSSLYCNDVKHSLQFWEKNTSEMEVARSALNCLHCLLGLHCLHCFIASNAHTVWTLLKSLKKWHVSPYCYMVREPIKNYLTDFFR